MPSVDKIFHQLLALQGKTIEVGTASSKEKLRGVLVNTMFDSFLLETNGKRRVVRFDDVAYLDEPARP